MFYIDNAVYHQHAYSYFSYYSVALKYGLLGPIFKKNPGGGPLDPLSQFRRTNIKLLPTPLMYSL